MGTEEREFEAKNPDVENRIWRKSRKNILIAKALSALFCKTAFLYYFSV
jgi:hypothetical protein